jgi:putative membrane protein
VKVAAYIGGLAGLALLVVLMVHADLTAMLHALVLTGGSLFWLLPYRALFFLLFAIGWFHLLRPYNSGHRAGLAYSFWVTTVREAIDRLLPVASVGGGVAAVRLMRWRGLDAMSVGATVIAEILLSLIVSYVFAALGFLLLIDLGAQGHEYGSLMLGLAASLPVPVLTALLLRYGSIFGRMQSWLRPLVGATDLSEGATSLDREVRATLSRLPALFSAGALQLAAMISGSFEIWFALRLFGHPVSVEASILLEGVNQGIRQVAFVIPAALGVQEAGLVLFGHALGINSELALAVSMAKRMREVLWGIASLISWQWLEGRRLHGILRDKSSSPAK